MLQAKQSGPIKAFIFGIIFIVVGYFVAFHFGLPILSDAKESTNWSAISGKITHSELLRSKSDGKYMYSFDVRYVFLVQGKEYEGDVVSFGANGMSSSSSSLAQSVLNKYKEGILVDIYYNPDDPHKSVLEPGATWESYLVFAVGLAFLMVGVLVAGGSIVKIILGGAVIIGAVGGLFASKKSHANDRLKHKGSSRSNHVKNNIENPYDDGIDIT